jgi:hypothetical protein
MSTAAFEHVDLLEQEIKFSRYTIDIISDMRRLFEKYFDQTWFSIILDDLPMEARTIREIRSLTDISYIHPGDEVRIEIGIKALELFIYNIRKFLMPVIKDKLGLSAFNRSHNGLDERTYVMRKLVLNNLPYNLSSLEALTRELKKS